VSPEAITAEYDNGIVTVHMPKAEEARGRKIDIEAK
jgi:HSP20 family molecular chaperone IbpA